MHCVLLKSDNHLPSFLNVWVKNKEKNNKKQEKAVHLRLDSFFPGINSIHFMYIIRKKYRHKAITSPMYLFFTMSRHLSHIRHQYLGY